MYETTAKRIRLWDRNKRNKLSHASVVNRAVFRLLYFEDGEPITPRQLSKKIIEERIAYPRDTRIRQIHNHIREVLDDMEKARIVIDLTYEKGKKGKNPPRLAYVLSATGRMIVACLPELFDFNPVDQRPRAMRNTDLEDFLVCECKFGNTLLDFPTDVMLKMLEGGGFESVKALISPLAIMVIENQRSWLSDSPALDLTSNIGLISRSLRDRKCYATAFLSLFRSLPKDQQHFMRMREKYQREFWDLREEVFADDEGFLKAILEGDERVNVPFLCVNCHKVFVKKKSIEQIYTAHIRGEKSRCPKCRTGGIRPNDEYDLLAKRGGWT